MVTHRATRGPRHGQQHARVLVFDADFGSARQHAAPISDRPTASPAALASHRRCSRRFGRGWPRATRICSASSRSTFAYCPPVEPGGDETTRTMNSTAGRSRTSTRGASRSVRHATGHGRCPRPARGGIGGAGGGNSARGTAVRLGVTFSFLGVAFSAVTKSCAPARPRRCGGLRIRS